MAFKAKLSLLLVFLSQTLIAQSLIQGIVYEKGSKETLIGANVIIPSVGQGTVTDFDGFFQMEVTSLPVTVEVSFIGFEKKSIVIENSELVKIYLGEDKLLLSEVVVVDSRLTEKQKQSPITVETMDVIAIKESPTASFYEGLGALKGVDVTSASLGFKIINTRGFNSTSPVRSLQIIDGVDNQSPGLNFSLGNFLGSSELDLKKVEIIVGANSALYGPNAFNGVISMETKDPFQYRGFSAQYKGGSRNLHEVAVRLADVMINRDGEEKLGYKFNFYKMSADDWVANNYDQAYDSPSLINNPGRYDAVNVYGDEYNTTYSDLEDYPGLRTFHRTGYKEEDLVDYNTENTKMSLALHYKITDDTELIYATNYGAGTTIYQGENRFSLKDLKFFQNRLELRKKDKFFIRLYETHEDAGNTYDAVATATALRNKHFSDVDWSKAYAKHWNKEIKPKITQLPGWQDPNEIDYYQRDDEGNVVFNESGIPLEIPGLRESWKNQMNEILDDNAELLAQYHQEVSEYIKGSIGTQGYGFLSPGTPEFEKAFKDITTQTRYDKKGNLIGGTKFYDRSKLYHAHAEYKHTIRANRLTLGANARMYSPNSDGTIFEDGRIMVDNVLKDLEIINKEYGVYLGYDRDFLSNTLILSSTIRVDKNENFDFLYSPAASIVYKPSENDVLRMSLSSAIRNPTLTDQYLNYDVGQAILIGNLNGFGIDEYFVNTDSLQSYFIGGTTKPDALFAGMMQVDPIKPEKVKTIEIGYRSTLFNKLYIDASAYYSIYEDFIGYQTGASFKFETKTATFVDVMNGKASEIGETIEDHKNIRLPSIQGYRVAANATDVVTTQGFTIGMNYFFNQNLTLNGNYSWNKLNKKGSDDPIIPAFNTPEHKYNIGFALRDINLSPNSKEWGLSMNYKWVESFVFEGSPQFTGVVPTYVQLDAQINKSIPVLNATMKIGASNLLDTKTYQVYGGPRVGRMLFTSIQFDL